MLLQSLLELVETLRKRIEKHGDALRAREDRTRYALINPLLQELGWDTTDPDLVIPEYSSGNGSADYALLDDGKPVMMVEAKKLDESLGGKTLSQGIQYCLEKGTEYFSVTNGRLWKIYKTHEPAPIDEKLIVSFDLKEQSPAEVCLKALALWRPGVEADYVAPANSPILGKISSSPDTDNLPPQPQEPDGHDWKPLSELDQKAMHDTKPTGIRFPDGSDVLVPEYRRAVPELVRWLTDNSKLSKPVRASRPGKFIVSHDGRHSDGSQMRMPLEVNGWFVSVQGGWWRHFHRAIRIIEHAGMNLAEFQLHFD